MTSLSEYKIHNFRLNITCVKIESNLNFSVYCHWTFNSVKLLIDKYNKFYANTLSLFSDGKGIFI